MVLKNQKKYKIAVIGCGNIGTKICKSFIDKKVFSKKEIIATGRNPKKLKALKNKIGVDVTTDNQHAVKNSQIILICVKPQDLKDVILRIKGSVSGKKIIVSVVAGVGIEFYNKLIPKKPVFRVIPSHLIESLSGIIIYSKNNLCKIDTIENIKRMFSPICEYLIEIPDKKMDVFSIFSAGNPALFYYFYNSILESAIENGLKGREAKKMIFLLARATSQHLMETNDNFKKTISSICTPNGITQEGVNNLNNMNLNKIIKTSIKKMIDRSKKISIRVKSSNNYKA